MKRSLVIFLVALAAMAPGATPKANAAAVSVSIGVQIGSVADFDARLSPYGSWVTVGSYGRCWRPTQVATGWRPYSVGSWVWTDAGWYWQSDEPWGWATCHYGSWDYDASLGWVWLPGTDWAPAWVSWRYSDDYIGWAPIGPNLTAPAPSFFAFVGVNRFHSGFRPNDLIVNNTTIINRTREVKNFQRETVNVDGHQRTIYSNKGPGTAPIERATGQKVTPRSVGEVARQTRAPEKPPGNQNQPKTTPSPTGREQSRTYSPQPQQAQPQRPTQPGQKPAELSPTGREQPTAERALPPAGREQSVPLPKQPAERSLTPTGHEQSQPPSQPTRENPLPPAGHEQSRTYSQPTETAPPKPNAQQPKEKERPQKEQSQPSKPEKPSQPEKQDKKDGSGT